MKTLKLFSFATFFLAIATLLSNSAFAQATTTESFKVSGNCGMCKSKIEKAAKEAGATYASWNEETKQLTVKYKSTSTNKAKIQQKIAGVGYDNAGFKAPDAAYNKLHGCCQYDRDEAAKAEVKCEMKDGKCTNMAACKDKGCCDANGVCKAGSCSHDGEHGAAGCCKKPTN